MKIIFAIYLTLLSSTYSFADTRVGKNFCMDFAKESIAKTFEGRSFYGKRLKGYYKEFANNDAVDAYILKVGEETTASMKKLCESKGDNVSIEDMKHDLRFKCTSTCGQERKAFKKPLITSEYNHNLKVGKYLDYCSELCSIPDDQLDTMLMGVLIQKKNQSPDCSGAVADSSRIKIKPITTDLDKINIEAVKKTSAK